jgi:hypothetical protein
VSILPKEQAGAGGAKGGTTGSQGLVGLDLGIADGVSSEAYRPRHGGWQQPLESRLVDRDDR